jgi:AraC-like DNA-binding protein
MHTHQDIEIMYVKSGGLELEEEGKHYTLKENDFFLINSNNRHGYTTQKNTLIGRFIIKYDEISDILQRDLVAFRCNSVEKRAKIDSKAYQELEQLIKDIFIQHYTKKREDYFLLESMQQRLLYLLVRDYMEEVTSLDHPLSLHQKAQRNQQLVDYIKQNYMNPLSLNELADKFFLSSAYLSKYFKRQFGLNFREYLRVIRLQRAVEAMLQTNKPLLQIAMEVGFPNINSFNHAFRNYYGETPSVYRKKQIAFDEAGQEEEQKKEGERREKPMESYQDFNAEHMVDHQVVYVTCSNPKTLFVTGIELLM